MILCLYIAICGVRQCIEDYNLQTINTPYLMPRSGGSPFLHASRGEYKVVGAFVLTDRAHTQPHVMVHARDYQSTKFNSDPNLLQLGLAIGTVMLCEEDMFAHYSDTLLSYYVAEGVSTQFQICRMSNQFLISFITKGTAPIDAFARFLVEPHSAWANVREPTISSWQFWHLLCSPKWRTL